MDICNIKVFSRSQAFMRQRKRRRSCKLKCFFEKAEVLFRSTSCTSCSSSRRVSRILLALTIASLGPSAFMLKPLHSLTTSLNLRPVTWPALVYGNTTVFHYASSPTAQGHVALTIDDGLCRSGAGRSMVTEVRELLKEHGAQATFFLCSDYVEDLEAEAKQLLEDGHEFANHCPKDGVDYYNMPPVEFETELLKTSSKIQELTGANPYWFRAPQGKYSGQMHGYVSKHGMQHALGDCYCDDWAIEDSQWVAGTMLQQARGGSVMIVHMPEKGFREHIFKALELLLIGLKERGLTVVTLSRLASLAARPAASAMQEEQHRGYSVITHHAFGHVDGIVFGTKEEALAHWRGLPLFSAHMLLGPDGKELRYYGRRDGRDVEMRDWAGQRNGPTQ
ncbi:unnamed protein product [Durusdinium trenchii]|uniref:NodB homology domain-containing protein n=1 Tax=Durusdinium trenchii TaxID=1381693 RepID=A0ABP0SX25_9DINO